MLHIKIPVFSTHWDQSCVGAFWIHVSALYLTPEKKGREGKKDCNTVILEGLASMFCWCWSHLCYCTCLCPLFPLPIPFPPFHFPSLSTFLRLFPKDKQLCPLALFSTPHIKHQTLWLKGKSLEKASTSLPANHQLTSRKRLFHWSLMPHSHSLARYIYICHRRRTHVHLYQAFLHALVIWKVTNFEEILSKNVLSQNSSWGHVVLASFLLMWNTLTSNLRDKGFIWPLSHH